MKLVILGGGGFRTPYVWQALIRDQGSPRVTEVALYDVDEARLATITAILDRLAERIRRRTHPEHPHRSRIRRGGRRLRVRRHQGRRRRATLLRRARRTRPQRARPGDDGAGRYRLRPAHPAGDARRRRDLRRVAPKAYFLNFTNPAGIITEALQSVLGDGRSESATPLRVWGDAWPASSATTTPASRWTTWASTTWGGCGGSSSTASTCCPRCLPTIERLARMEETQVFGAEWLRTLG